MEIEVRLRGIERSHALEERILRRAQLQLGRLSGAVSAVVVKISDINGPKGGVDKRCQVTVRGPSLGPVTIDELSEDAYSAVDLALARAARAAVRGIERGRAHRRADGVLGRAS